MKTINDHFILSGQLNDYYDIKISGNLSLLSILFKPHGLSMFTNIPVNEFYNQNIPLQFVFPKETNRLENELSTANSFTERISKIEEFLFRQLLKAEKPNANRIENCIYTINHSKGLVDIRSLASETCLGRKQFERTFANSIGVSPKQFLKVIRFQNALHEKSKHRNLSLTELAYNCGYYDQSYMINDFQQLSGLSPKGYFCKCGPVSDYFQ